MLVVLLLSLMLTSTAFAGYDLEDILKLLQSEESSERRKARNILSSYLEYMSEEKRREAFKKLFDLITLPKSSYRLKLGICEGIGKMRRNFWEVENQEKTEMKLYGLFKKEKNYTLKMSLDNALMTAKGLYWDAFYDYNHDRVDDPEAVAKKFRKFFQSYPDCRLASRAHFYLAKYYTRVYLILKHKKENPDPETWINEKSNGVFKEFILKIGNNTYRNVKELQAARYFMALNFVLLDRFEEAKALLREIIADSQGKAAKSKIYIYQFYFSYNKKYRVDEYFPAGILAEHTLKYLEKKPGYNEKYLRSFVKHFKKIRRKMK
jgi:hypothetical protein